MMTKLFTAGTGYTGLTGTIGYTIYSATGSVSTARTTAGITELVTGSGIYASAVTAPSSGGGVIIWDCGVGVNLTPVELNDPWAVPLDGVYATGQAGFELSTASSQSSLSATLAEGITTDLQSGITVGGGGFSGPDEVTFSFLSSLGVPVSYVQFAVVDVGLATTDVDGVITLGLNSGSYTVVAAPTNGVMWASQAFTVSGNTTVDVTGTAVPAPPTPTPTECPDIYGVISAKVISFPRPPVGCDMNWQIGDTQPLVSIILLDGNNKPINLANASAITIEYASAGLTTVVQSSSMYPSTDGIYCYYERAATDYTTENGGWYNARVIVGFAGDTGFSAPTVGSLQLFVGTPFVSL